MKKEILIICIGNTLAGDDACGFHIFSTLQALRLPTDLELRFLELGGLDLIEILQGEKLLIIVDAVQFGFAAGTIHRIDLDREAISQTNPLTSHDLGVLEALEICRTLYPEKMPDKTILIGVEGSSFDEPGSGLSPLMGIAVEEAVAEILRLIRQSQTRGEVE